VKLGAAASFSTAVDPVPAATEGQDPAAWWQLRPAPRGDRRAAGGGQPQEDGDG